MGERFLIVDHLKFSYEGVFNVAEFYNLIGSWFFEKGWDWTEQMNQELITPEGKQIRIILHPWKSVTEFYKLWMVIKIYATDVKDVEIEHNNQILKLNQGLIRMTFDGYVQVDRVGDWTSKPLWWFFTIIAQKYFFRDHFKKIEDWIRSDVDDLIHKIKTYTNTLKYTYQS